MGNEKLVIVLTMIYVVGVMWWGAPAFRQSRRCVMHMNECVERKRGDTWNYTIPFSALKLPGVYRELYGEDEILAMYSQSCAKLLKAYCAVMGGLFMGVVLLGMVSGHANR
jgi:hypothetical protein